ncbi:hypothetical protein [Nocardia brasiliensis]|uniref:hypothetical protein n=1 Tax=Nocardia brasiliensis TaxID=37326 RepID=UPI002455D22D|nr:hypothetical protein [Nocardia brasiliensis]
MKTETPTRDHDAEPVPYLPIDRGVIVTPQPEPELSEFVIKLPNGRLRCRTLAVAGDTRPTGPVVFRGTLTQAWQELKNYRQGVMDQYGLRRGAFRPHLLSWPDCQPVRRLAVASRVRPQARRPHRQAVAR